MARTSKTSLLNSPTSINKLQVLIEKITKLMKIRRKVDSTGDLHI